MMKTRYKSFLLGTSILGSMLVILSPENALAQARYSNNPSVEINLDALNDLDRPSAQQQQQQETMPRYSSDVSVDRIPLEAPVSYRNPNETSNQAPVLLSAPISGTRRATQEHSDHGAPIVISSETVSPAAPAPSIPRHIHTAPRVAEEPIRLRRPPSAVDSAEQSVRTVTSPVSEPAPSVRTVQSAPAEDSPGPIGRFFRRDSSYTGSTDTVPVAESAAPQRVESIYSAPSQAARPAPPPRPSFLDVIEDSVDRLAGANNRATSRRGTDYLNAPVPPQPERPYIESNSPPAPRPTAPTMAAAPAPAPTIEHEETIAARPPRNPNIQIDVTPAHEIESTLSQAQQQYQPRAVARQEDDIFIETDRRLSASASDRGASPTAAQAQMPAPTPERIEISAPPRRAPAPTAEEYALSQTNIVEADPVSNNTPIRQQSYTAPTQEEILSVETIDLHQAYQNRDTPPPQATPSVADPQNLQVTAYQAGQTSTPIGREATSPDLNISGEIQNMRSRVGLNVADQDIPEMAPSAPPPSTPPLEQTAPLSLRVEDIQWNEPPSEYRPHINVDELQMPAAPPIAVSTMEVSPPPRNNIVDTEPMAITNRTATSETMDSLASLRAYERAAPLERSATTPTPTATQLALDLTPPANAEDRNNDDDIDVATEAVPPKNVETREIQTPHATITQTEVKTLRAPSDDSDRSAQNDVPLSRPPFADTPIAELRPREQQPATTTQQPPTEAQVITKPAPTQQTASMMAMPRLDDMTLVFDGSTTELSGALRSQLNPVIQTLKADQNSRLQLRSYARSVDGSESSARRISLARAIEVRRLLLDEGIDPTRIDVRALGESTEETPVNRMEMLYTN